MAAGANTGSLEELDQFHNRVVTKIPTVDAAILCTVIVVGGGGGSSFSFPPL